MNNKQILKNMKNQKKQTAVEWIEDSIQLDMTIMEVLGLIRQAKAMEKEQQDQLSACWAKSREQTRETAMHIGFSKGFMSGLECHEDYYLELERSDLDEDEFTRNYIVDEFEKKYGGNKWTINKY